MSDIYYGRGSKEHFDDYMDFINYVFGFNGNESDFKKLLPKLYTIDAMPAYYSFNAIEEGKFRAAIGAFPGAIKVCGIELKTCGIGNVAVHPYYRGEGYMKKCLNMAIDDMIANGVDLSALGGQRQRYNYFSYEKAGATYQVSVNKTNLRHAFGSSKTDVEAIAIKAEDKEYLDYVKDAYKKSDFVPYRDENKLFDILRTWRACPYIFKKDGKISGYCVLGGNEITEVYAEDKALIVDFVRALMENNDSITVSLPTFKAEYLEYLEPVCDRIVITDNHMFTVLNFKKVILAFMLLKSTYETLAEGEFKVLIHGRAKDEQLKITVKGGEISVENTEEAPDIELSHLDAMRFFFTKTCYLRNKYPVCKLWFPLPIWEFSADAV